MCSHELTYVAATDSRTSNIVVEGVTSAEKLYFTRDALKLGANAPYPINEVKVSRRVGWQSEGDDSLVLRVFMYVNEVKVLPSTEKHISMSIQVAGPPRLADVGNEVRSI
jgi:hypothetical protein